MIYVIKTPKCNFDNQGKVVKFFEAIKIGYTNDEELDPNKNSRLLSYRGYFGNSMYVIKLIPNGTESQEKKLHHLFQKYLCEGNEWFYYNDEIINYIDSIIVDELDDLEVGLLNDEYLGFSSVFRTNPEILKLCKSVVSYVIGKEDKIQFNDYLSKLHKYFIKNGVSISKLTENDVLDYVKNDPNIDKTLLNNYFVYRKFLKDGIIDNYSGVCDLKELHRFAVNFESLKSPYDKLKLLSKYGLSEKESDKNLVKNFIDLLSCHDFIKIYYTNLGPNRVRALGYDTFKIRKELGIVMFDRDKLREEIYSNFHEGDKIPVSVIKSMLIEIYDRIGYKKSPKATDLNNYFEIKSCKLSSTTENKRVAGFELIKKLLD